jgi:AraC-like DNA-binding protein
MRYREIKPSAAMSLFVRCYWVLEDDDASRVQRIVPDGRAELILNLGESYEAQRDGQWTRQPECFLIGQITGPLVLRASGPVRIIGVTFHPHTAGRLLKVPMIELTDTSVSVGDLSGGLRELKEVDEVGGVERVLDGLARRAGDEDRLLSAAVNQTELSVGEMAGRAGLSARQFERRFRQAVGIPPKLFSRMRRFQRVFAALESAPVRWADAAVECGYYDQAHLIRDFQEFAGKPPAALLAEDTDLARHFVSHFSNTRAEGAG